MFNSRLIEIRVRNLAAGYARVVSEPFAPRNQRAQGMPGAQCARSLACVKKQTHELVTTVTPEQPGIPRAMVLRLTSRSSR
jgi:hypothetical protein